VDVVFGVVFGVVVGAGVVGAGVVGGGVVGGGVVGGGVGIVSGLGVTVIEGSGVGSRTSAAAIGPVAATTAASTADPAATRIPSAQRTTHVFLQFNGTATAPSTSPCCPNHLPR